MRVMTAGPVVLHVPSALSNHVGEGLFAAARSGRLRRIVAALYNFGTWYAAVVPHLLDDVALDLFDGNGRIHLVSDQVDISTGNTSTAAIAALEPGLLTGALPATVRVLFDAGSVTSSIASMASDIGRAVAATFGVSDVSAARLLPIASPVPPPGRIVLHPNRDSFIAARRRDGAAGITAQCAWQPFALWRVALFLAGMVLAISASSLAHSAAVYYGTGAVAFSITALFLIILALRRQRRRVWIPATIFAATSSTARWLGVSLSSVGLRFLVGDEIAAWLPRSFGAALAMYVGIAAVIGIVVFYVLRQGNTAASFGVQERQGWRFSWTAEICLRAIAAGLLYVSVIHPRTGIVVALALPLRPYVGVALRYAGSCVLEILVFIPGAGAAFDAVFGCCCGTRGICWRRRIEAAGERDASGAMLTERSSVHDSARQREHARAAFIAAASAAVDDETVAPGVTLEARAFVRELLMSPHLERYASAVGAVGGTPFRKLQQQMPPTPAPARHRRSIGVQPRVAAAGGKHDVDSDIREWGTSHVPANAQSHAPSDDVRDDDWEGPIEGLKRERTRGDFGEDVDELVHQEGDDARGPGDYLFDIVPSSERAAERSAKLRVDAPRQLRPRRTARAARTRTSTALGQSQRATTRG